ncbi:MAG TPA: hypothetical protein VGM18_18630 [Candidatus Sulfotelmatobacter sp.]|jgi:hypothetical protein
MSETEIIFVFRKSPEGGFEARALGCSIFTQAETLDELTVNVTDAIACHFGDTSSLPVARLTEVQPKRFILGSAKGEFTVPDDFDDPLPKDVEDLFW